MTTTRRRSTRGRTAAPRSALGGNLRLGLCCLFRDVSIAFRTTTATSLLRKKPAERLAKLSELCLANAKSLGEALRYCAAHGIGAFRVVSSILPIKTHPEAGYAIHELRAAETIVAEFRRCGAFAIEHGIRLTFHPDQFVVLNSPRADVVRKSIADLEYHAEIAEWIGADVINIHAGGAYGDKSAALVALLRNLDRVSDAVRSRLTIENDDVTFTPTDLLPICRAAGLPLVYDVHHHRCLADELSVESATAAALTTWNREPLLHISSPLAGWSGPRPQRHHDFIDVSDFPDCWRGLQATVDVEAKAKEQALFRLRDELAVPAPSGRGRSLRGAGT